MPQRLFRVTPARTDTWLTCPRKYRFRYVDRPAPPPGPAWAHQSVGAAVHNALLRFYEQEPSERDPDNVARLVGSSWLDAGFRDERQSQEYRDRASGWVREYVAGQPADLRPLALERGVACRDDRAAYSGRVDRIDVRDGELVVVDYKTGRNPPTEAEARSSPALALYLVAARQTLRLPGARVELHHLPTNTVAAAEHSPESLSRHRDRLVDLAAEAEAATGESFPANPGPICGWCDYYAHCPEGRRAAPDRPVAWAGLPD
jgi:RecB family exonuclease